MAKKNIEDRINSGPPTAVREQDVILLGSMNVRILEIIRFCSFEEMFDRFGVASVFPSCPDVEQAVATEKDLSQLRTACTNLWRPLVHEPMCS